MVNIKIKGAIVASTVGTVFWIVSALANPPQQSDSTGTNSWNNTAPIFDIESQLDPQTLIQAQELYQALQEAYSACVASVERAENLPRRFSRISRENSGICISAECTQYNRLLEETKTFLSLLDIPEEERLKALQNLRTW
ncbi:hypothetical protein [Oscillatoria sp. HE19RPO]|uniref:hypothetical protein n=1 Tax=Oscillatoria sp. HE19RPO TaxID=2954806 RepID=UPI0020C26123|nr:hypothetical protein [Oscillatoria sp. HE19RPO]